MTPEAIAGLARLRRKFVDRARQDLLSLRRHRAAPLAPEDLHLVVHRLAGAAGTFGFAALSSAAEAAEYALLFQPAAEEAALRELVAVLRSTIAAEALSARGPLPAVQPF